MNTKEREYRFLELMSAVSMLPSVEMNGDDLPETSEEWVFPNYANGLSDERIARAVLAQTLQEDEEFQFKVVTTLCNSAITSIKSKENGANCSDEIEALGLALVILWATYRVKPMLGLMGIVGSICMEYDLYPPMSLGSWIQNPASAEHYKDENPLELVRGKSKG